jgi:hypothetical protein
MERRSFLVWLPVLLLAPAGICVPPNPNFSGTWKQSNERCTPTRTGDVTLYIDHRDPDLTVKTIVLRSSGSPRHEDGRIILSKETWKLIENGNALERSRERNGDRAGKQTIIYLREAPNP